LAFSDINNEIKQVLGKKILDIQRELRAHAEGPP